MTRSRLALAGAAIAAATALALVPAAAQAHTNNLFVWLDDGDEGFAGFGAISKTDASFAPLGANTAAELDWVTGMEVCGEVGYAVGQPLEDDVFVATWNHDTGALLAAPVDVFIDDADVEYLGELDTLADCTLIGIAVLDGPEVPVNALVQIDPATGELTVLASLDSVPLPAGGVATDASGTTYVFFSDYGSNAGVATVNLATGVLSGVDELTGLVDYYEGGGPTFGVDFDAAGTMYMIIGADSEEVYHLTSFPAGSVLPDAEPVDVGALPFDSDFGLFEPFPLTAEGAIAPPAPQLAATGAELPLGVAFGAGILLLGGLALVAIRRRTAQ